MSNKKIAINGAKWTTSATVINTLLNFMQMAILARLLDARIFGIIGISTLVVNFFHIFSNLGFSNSVISRQEEDRKKLSTIFFTSIGLGILVCILISISSPFVADFYNEPRLVRLLIVASLSFPLITTGQLYWILLQKEFNFKILAAIEVICNILGVVGTILLAYNGFEELSLIYSQLFYIAIRTFLYIFFGSKYFRPLLHFKIKEIKDHLHFGAFSIGEGVLGYAGSNIESIVIGKAISLEALGYYNIAFQLAVFPIYKLNPIIMQVSYPIMAKMKDSQGLKRAYLKIVDFITFCNFPLLTGLLVTSAGIVPLIYGPGWEQSVDLIKIIIFVGFLYCISAPFSSIAFTKGKPNLVFYVNLSVLIFKLIAVYFLAKSYGLYGIAYAYLLSTILEIVLSLSSLKYLIGNFFTEFLNNIWKPILFCTIMALAITIYKYFLPKKDMFTVVSQIVIGGVVYIGLVLRYKLSLKEIRELKKSL